MRRDQGRQPTSRRTRTRRARAGTASSSGTCAPSAAESTGAAKSQTPNIALAHGSVPGGLDLTGFCVDCDAVVDAVVDEHVGIGTAAERAVLVAVRRGLIGRTGEIVAGPLAVVRHRREIHRLGVDEFQALEGVIGADPEAAEHQVRDRARLASGVVLVIPEGGIHHVMTVIVVLVAADRVIRQLRASASCGRKPFPRRSWGCRCSRFRPRTASQRPLR